MDKLDKLKKFLEKNDHFGHGFMGVEIIEFKEGCAKVRIKLEQKMMNARGITHGGVIFSLADSAAGVAMATTMDASVTLTSNITYIGLSTEGYLYAEAKMISSTYRTASFYVTVTNEQGALLATLQTVMYKKPIK